MRRKYDDIINLPRHVSPKRSPMAIINRAAQFSPFAALAGYDTAIKEAARLTDERIELDENMKEALNNRLQILASELKSDKSDREVEITYFRPDEKKSGGAYVKVIGRAKKIDTYRGHIIMADHIVVPINDIIKIEGKIFE